MNYQGFNESDWKLFRKKVPEWQEAYMNRLNEEYIQLLSENAAPSVKFWRLERRIKADRNKSGVQLDMRRSMMINNLIQLIAAAGFITKDLRNFAIPNANISKIRSCPTVLFLCHGHGITTTKSGMSPKTGGRRLLPLRTCCSGGSLTLWNGEDLYET